MVPQVPPGSGGARLALEPRGAGPPPVGCVAARRATEALAKANAGRARVPLAIRRARTVTCARATPLHLPPRWHGSDRAVSAGGVGQRSVRGQLELARTDLVS